jgi:hypothetical protein
MALQRHAARVVDLLHILGARAVVSVGVGNGMLEYLLLSRDPSLSIRCGDYATKSLDNLRDRFPECQSVELMDIREPTWIRPGEVLLMNRVDMELTDSEWRDVFKTLSSRGVDRIVWVPCGLLTLTSALVQIRTAITALVLRRPLARAGFLRTERSMIELFAGDYRHSLANVQSDYQIWVLTRRQIPHHVRR